MKLLSDKVAIITGASGGLGEAQAIEYVKQGAKVMINGTNKDKLDKVTEKIKSLGGDVLPIIGDVSDEKDIQHMVDETIKHFGKVDICVNNAALLADFKKVEEISTEEFDRIMGVNVRGVFLMTKALLPHFLKQGGGTFINVSSIGGTIAGVGDSAYIASKHAVNGFTKQVAYEYAHKGIRALTLCPGLTETPMVSGALDDAHPQVLRQINSTPSGEIGDPEDVGFFSAYLASDKAKRINGVSMHIDGGQSIGGEASWVNPQNNK